MQWSKCTDIQIIDAVKRVESVIGVQDICRESGVCSATVYKWSAKYGGINVSMMPMLKDLQK
jgi:putative transposase